MGGGTKRGGMFGGNAPIRTPGIGDGMNDSDPFRAAFGDMLTQNADSGIARPDPLARLIGQAPKRNTGGVGDVLSTILAVAADATDPEGRNRFTSNLANQWAKRGEDYDQKLAAYQNRETVANLPGMNEREMVAYMTDPKAWGGHMSDAATSHYQASTLNPGDVRQFGKDGPSIQAPTRGQQYAQSLALQPGTAEYETAIRDQELGAQGPTGFQNNMQLEGVRQSGRVGLENLRQKGRMGMEGVRQGNRTALRGVPTYSQLHPPPPRLGGRSVSAGGAVTATNPQTGEKMMFVGGKWVPAK